MYLERVFLITLLLATTIQCSQNLNGTFPSSGGSISLSEFVLGQINATTANIYAKGMRRPEKVFVYGNKLLVADSIDNRILIWNSLPTSSGQVADLVLGQSNIQTNGGNTQSKLSQPTCAITDGTRVVVCDYNNNRVMIWNSFPTVNNQPADIVLGQATFTTRSFGTSAQELSLPYDAVIDGNKLIVSDSTNARVLIWDPFPTVNQQAATYVIGQTNMTNASTGSSATELNTPMGLWVQSGALFVVDSGNSRVLKYNTVPTASTAAADIAIGAADPNSSGGGTSATRMSMPTQVTSDGTRLFVVDQNNHRVLIWNTIPTLDDQAANIVVGQTLMTDNNSDPVSATRFDDPVSVATDGTRLYIADRDNMRIAIFNTIPTGNNAAANLALGQDDVSSADNINTLVTASTLAGPNSFTTDGTRYFVVDNEDNRILIWNSRPTSDNQPADVVLGQTDMTSRGGGTTASTFSFPYYVHSDGTQLYVADAGNSRILIWNSIPTTNGQAADLALGQPDLTSGVGNQGGAASDLTLSIPSSVTTCNGKLVVTDNQNTRILIWNTIPTDPIADMNKPADVVIGQANMTATGAATTRTGLQGAVHASCDADHLYVADTENNRVLIYTPFPTSDGPLASVVLGQPDFVTNNPGTSATEMYAPRAVVRINDSLYVSDVNNLRILKWNTIPTSTVAASAVFNQSDFTSATPQAVGRSTFGTPLVFSGTSTHILISDPGYMRVLENILF